MREIRLIDANDLYDSICEEYHDTACHHTSDMARMIHMTEINHFLYKIQKQKTIDPVTHAHWEEHDYPVMDEHTMIVEYRIPNGGLTCSNCKTGFRKDKLTYKNFCSFCGAHMDGKEEDKNEDGG